MCNHYEKNVEVLEWAARLVEAPQWVVNREGDVVHPDDTAAFQTHTWPKSLAPVVMQTPARRTLTAMRWGVRVEVRGETKPLVKLVTNARDDKLTGFTWRYSVAERRCLIPATAYYEPDGPPGGKWEVRFTLRDRPMFYLAGLWDTDPDQVTRSFTMVTTSPNELAAKIHDRMPLVLDDAAALEWLGHTPLPADRLRELCRPFSAERMQSIALPPPDRPIKKADLQNAGQQELLF